MHAPVTPAASARAPVSPGSPGLMTVPNLLTLSRPALGLAVWMLRDQPTIILGLMAMAAATDVLDGWVARRRARRLRLPLTSSPGVWLDPLCDKVFIAFVLAAIYVRFGLQLGWVALVLTRDLLLGPIVVVYRSIPALRRRRRLEYQSAQIGKLTTVAQYLAAGAFVVRSPSAPLLAMAAGASGLGAVIHYARHRARPIAVAPLPVHAAEEPARHDLHD
jgi:cardiolipin synthase (CMP-forming)